MDTREITRRLRDTGALNGIITTDMTTPAEELVEKTKSWSILGKVVPSPLRAWRPLTLHRCHAARQNACQLHALEGLQCRLLMDKVQSGLQEGLLASEAD